jgi:hypothetical protein
MDKGRITMKGLMKIMILTACFLGVAGCSSHSHSAGSVPTGTMAPPVSSMTQAQLQARLKQVMPKGMPTPQAQNH